MARDSVLADALYEDFFVNSPFAIARTTVFGGLLWLLMAPAVAGEAAARDVATGMHPLTYTAPGQQGRVPRRAIPRRLRPQRVDPARRARLGILLGRLLARRGCRGHRSVPAGRISHGLRLHRAAERLHRDGDPVLAGGAERPRHGRATSAACSSSSWASSSPSLLLFKRGPGDAAGSDRHPLHHRTTWRIEWTTIEKNTRLFGLEGAVLAEPPPVARHRAGRRSHSPTCAFASPIAPRAAWWSRIDATARCARPDAGRHRRHGERADLRPAGPRRRSASPSTRARRSPSRGTRSGRSRRAGPDSSLLAAIPLLTVARGARSDGSHRRPAAPHDRARPHRADRPSVR